MPLLPLSPAPRPPFQFLCYILLKYCWQLPNSIKMSSDCSLSSAPASPEPKLEPQLQVLRQNPRWYITSTPSITSTTIKKSSTYILTAGCFTRTSLDTSPASVLYGCMQPDCYYTTPSPSHRVLSTSNQLKHYHGWHKGIATSKAEAKQAWMHLIPLGLASFATMILGKVTGNLVNWHFDLVVSNNLPLRIVESLSFRRWVACHNPYVFLCCLIDNLYN
jgi:hypothetical protein